MAYLKAGYDAFILRYSVGENHKWPEPLEDYEDAMEYIANHAEEWNVLADKIAVVGFSAGGHLAGAAATIAKHKPAAVYLPKDYDENREKPYPVLYLSHGGSESLSTWLNQGSMSQMMDSLIAGKKIEPTFVVTMDNSVYQWNHKEKNIPNLVECLMPYMEEHYHIATEPEGRAFAGLSAGGFLAFDVFASVGYLFGNIGIWSGGRRFEADYTKPYMKEVHIHIGAGRYDNAYRAFAEPLEEELRENKIPYTIDIIPGAHQWSVWRKLLEIFLKERFKRENV